ncbi:hypothetical protein [Myxococcus phage Mx1]|nr:hypothetical protein [Myxococcus phage Mx1]
MSELILWGVVVLVVWMTVRKRRAILRWWRTKPCPHPNCFGRMPGQGMQAGTWGQFVIEECEVCENHCAWNRDSYGSGKWVRWHV